MSCCCDIELSLCLPVGTAPSWVFAVVDPETADDPVDITGVTFEFFVKERAADADGDSVFSLTSADGEIVITEAADGAGQINNTAAKSALLAVGRYYYWSLRMTSATGEIRTVRKGTLRATTG